jgi:PIN domain nuclease of toxin-antitoxin system
VILVDTHVLIWVYQGPTRQISPAVRARLNREQLGLSPFSLLELQYLHEIGRLQPSPQGLVSHVASRLAIVTVDISATILCDTAAQISWTRDPFDRLLAAHATAQGLTFVTKDEAMRRHLPLAWWA